VKTALLSLKDSLRQLIYQLLTKRFTLSNGTDTVGKVEYKTDYINNTRKPNARIADFTPYQKYVDTWMVEAQKPLPPTPVKMVAAQS
jgi:hypothetical protein